MPRSNFYTDPALLQRIAQGDPLAFRQLFTAHSRQVYTLCLRLTKDAELAKDLTQEIFARLWTRRDRLEGVTHFKSYLTTIALNLVRNYLQKRVLDISNEDYLLSYLAENAMEPDREMEFKELQEALQEAVDHLPPQLNRSFVLSRVEGMSHSEIADQMHLSPLTVKSHIARALTFIRAYLEQHHPKLVTMTLLCFFSNYF